jgi:hypothetical protein
MTTIFDHAASALSDDELLSSVKALASAERRATARLIAALAELDRRRLFLGLGYSSLFNYCTQALHLSEHAAYGRIEAVRATNRFPVVLTQLTDGDVTLTTICLLAPLLTDENHEALLAAARHKSRRDNEQLVVATRPKPDAPAVVRKLPSPTSGDSAGAPAPTKCDSTPSGVPATKLEGADPAARWSAPTRPPATAVATPLAPERFKIQFTASREAYEKLLRARALLRHVIPNGDLACVFERALETLLADLERRKLASTNRPRPAREAATGSRHIPAAVRRAVWQRDQRTVRLRGRRRPMCRARLPRTPPRRALRQGRGSHGWQHRVALSCPQCVRGRAVLRIFRAARTSGGIQLGSNRVRCWHNSGASLRQSAVPWRSAPLPCPASRERKQGAHAAQHEERDQIVDRDRTHDQDNQSDQRDEDLPDHQHPSAGRLPRDCVLEQHDAGFRIQLMSTQG